MGRKSKVPYELKILSVEKYIKGNKSLSQLARTLEISIEQFRIWVLKYNNSHNKWKFHNTKENKIMTKGRKITYNERVEIVAFCIENNDNYQLTSNKYKVSYQQVYTCVRKYKENGYESLRDNRGKRKNIDQMSETEKLNSQIRLLEAKNKQLEMENNFLKKLEEVERRR